MRDIKVASRYAKSLLSIALEQNSLEELHNDMVLVNDVCIANRDLVLLLKSPIVSRDKKKNILTEIFAKNVAKISLSFINIILTKKREGLLPDIASTFIDIYKQQKNIKTIQITTATTLQNEQKEKIISLLKTSEKSTIEIKEVVDEDIIGGLILRIEDKQIDESIRRKLSDLTKEFERNPYVKEF